MIKALIRFFSGRAIDSDPIGGNSVDAYSDLNDQSKTGNTNQFIRRAFSPKAGETKQASIPDPIDELEDEEEDFPYVDLGELEQRLEVVSGQGLEILTAKDERPFTSSRLKAQKRW